MFYYYLVRVIHIRASIGRPNGAAEQRGYMPGVSCPLRIYSDVKQQFGYRHPNYLGRAKQELGCGVAEIAGEQLEVIKQEPEGCSGRGRVLRFTPVTEDHVRSELNDGSLIFSLQEEGVGPLAEEETDDLRVYREISLEDHVHDDARGA